jgi:NAD+ synthase (glutamine-hydrolysing)
LIEDWKLLTGSRVKNPVKSMMVPSDIFESNCILATCNLNQWALDFDGNLERIMLSIQEAKERGAKLRLGPELEISGYSCEDHFHEMDTYMHCDQSLAAILSSDVTCGILCDIGMPIIHNNVRYNCRVFCLDKKIILIRPKVFMADDGNYRERRYFTSWKDEGVLEDHALSDILRDASGGSVVPFGVATIATMETIIAAEICEELWTPNSPHISLALAGVEIVTNGSGSHHELRKLDSRLGLMKSATRKCGGAYLYANHRGCDGNRVYFDGCSLVCVNGEVVSQASQFSLNEVEVLTAIVDLNEIRSYRQSSASFQEQSSACRKIPQINLRHFSLRTKDSLSLAPNRPISLHIHTPEEECAMGPACWMWDYLRRSNASGFLLPLSGGADSSSVAAIVRVMCGMAVDAAASGNKQVLYDMQRIVGYPVHTIKTLTTDTPPTPPTSSGLKLHLNLSPEQLCNSVLHTVYMGTGNSSAATRSRSKRLAEAIGSYHNNMNIDAIVSAVLHVFTSLASVCTPSSGSNEVCSHENLNFILATCRSIYLLLL